MYSTLAVNSILYSVAINELEGSGGATAFDSMSRTLAEFSGGETQCDLTLGESQISNLTFGILQSMVKTWLLDKVQQYYVDITAILAIDSW
jgi:DNA polymerase epsilon subunit 1